MEFDRAARLPHANHPTIRRQSAAIETTSLLQGRSTSREYFVGCDNLASGFIATADEFEEQIGMTARIGQIA